MECESARTKLVCPPFCFSDVFHGGTHLFWDECVNLLIHVYVCKLVSETLSCVIVCLINETTLCVFLFYVTANVTLSAVCNKVDG